MLRAASMDIIHEHYLRKEVQREVVDFARERWVALHCLNNSGKLVLRRYIWGKPIKIGKIEDLRIISNYKVRSIYATANVYRRINSFSDIYDPKNIAYCTPTWDIDSNLTNWRDTIRVAKEIIEFLGEWGIKESVYIKWSGNGCHIHINERSFSENLLAKYNPLDLAYAIVEYVNAKIFQKLMEPSVESEIKIENKMDLTRIFTCPLSLHRELNAVCICMKPEDLDNFSPEWINPKDFRHNPRWREFREGEVDRLAEIAYKTLGGYPLKFRRRKRGTKPLDKQIMEWLQKD
ncbi:MAG: hypothetical protein QXX99_03270 [Candidatus Bathyarchaeia archaeon]